MVTSYLGGDFQPGVVAAAVVASRPGLERPPDAGPRRASSPPPRTGQPQSWATARYRGKIRENLKGAEFSSASQDLQETGVDPITGNRRVEFGFETPRISQFLGDERSASADRRNSSPERIGA